MYNARIFLVVYTKSLVETAINRVLMEIPIFRCAMECKDDPSCLAYEFQETTGVSTFCAHAISKLINIIMKARYRYIKFKLSVKCFVKLISYLLAAVDNKLWPNFWLHQTIFENV